MSTKLVEGEIKRFLSTREPEVISISGRWGVGKTYAWDRYLTDAKAGDGIALSHYAYVSLFGVNSLDELKYSVFENSVASSDIGLKPGLKTLRSNTTAVAARLGRKSLWFLQQLPLVKNYAGGLGPVWFLSVNECIVCLDDIERRGRGLTVREVLGLVSNLKEQKRCKIVLILNDEALEEDQEDFRKYLDKVVDTSLKFEPSPEECVRIALPGNAEPDKLLAEYCVALGISNIRVIKRVERSVRRVEALLREFDRQLLRQAVHSLTILGWSVYVPHRAPSLDYLLKRRAFDVVDAKDKPIPANHAAWNALLDAYGFSEMDEFDLALLDGVQKGFFDGTLVRRHASEMNNRIEASKLDRSFQDAWQNYHNSFDDNEQEVLDAIYTSFFKGARNINPMNLNGTVSLFKELGRREQAAEMIRHYIASHGEDRRLFDLRSYPFAGDVKDPDVVQAFSDKYATFENKQNPASILISIARTSSWNPEDISMLSSLPVEDYYRLFKETRAQTCTLPSTLASNSNGF